MDSLAPASNQWTRVIVLTPEGNGLGEDLQRLFAARDWFAVTQHDAALALAELCVRERAQAARTAWGLTRMEQLALLVLHPEHWPGLPHLIAAASRYVPGAALWSAGDEPAVEPLNARARALEAGRESPPRPDDDMSAFSGADSGAAPAHSMSMIDPQPDAADPPLRMPPRLRPPLRSAPSRAAAGSFAPALRLTGDSELPSLNRSRDRDERLVVGSRGLQPASAAATQRDDAEPDRDGGRLTREEIDMLLAGGTAGEVS